MSKRDQITVNRIRDCYEYLGLEPVRGTFQLVPTKTGYGCCPISVWMLTMGYSGLDDSGIERAEKVHCMLNSQWAYGFIDAYDENDITTPLAHEHPAYKEGFERGKQVLQALPPAELA